MDPQTASSPDPVPGSGIPAMPANYKTMKNSGLKNPGDIVLSMPDGTMKALTESFCCKPRERESQSPDLAASEFPSEVRSLSVQSSSNDAPASIPPSSLPLIPRKSVEVLAEETRSLAVDLRRDKDAIEILHDSLDRQLAIFFEGPTRFDLHSIAIVMNSLCKSYTRLGAEEWFQIILTLKHMQYMLKISPPILHFPDFIHDSITLASNYSRLDMYDLA